tara:strand:+ start:17 stop:937 length:921 start_codon:yes stop_codon:yes gene_type:complete
MKKMNYSFIPTIILIASLLLLTSCGEEKKQVTAGAFLGGTSGAAVSFEPISVLEEGIYTIFDTEDFPLEFILKNKGEENILPGTATLRLLGPAQGDFSNIPSWELLNKNEIEKISEFNPTGGEEIISFTPNNYATYNNEVIGYMDINWNLEYWYDYKTHLIINDVCFKGDPTDKKVCEIKGTKIHSVSGAPISVSSVEEDTGGKGIVLLKININNVGTGDSTIIGQEFDDRFDQISYTTDEPDKWECKSGGREGQARLIDGKAQIICRLKNPLGEEEIYQRTVRLTFDYIYKELIQEKLRIKESAK